MYIYIFKETYMKNLFHFKTQFNIAYQELIFMGKLVTILYSS